MAAESSRFGDEKYVGKIEIKKKYSASAQYHKFYYQDQQRKNIVVRNCHNHYRDLSRNLHHDGDYVYSSNRKYVASHFFAGIVRLSKSPIVAVYLFLVLLSSLQTTTTTLTMAATMNDRNTASPSSYSSYNMSFFRNQSLAAAYFSGDKNVDDLDSIAVSATTAAAATIEGGVAIVTAATDTTNKSFPCSSSTNCLSTLYSTENNRLVDGNKIGIRVEATKEDYSFRRGHFSATATSPSPSPTSLPTVQPTFVTDVTEEECFAKISPFNGVTVLMTIGGAYNVSKVVGTMSSSYAATATFTYSMCSYCPSKSSAFYFCAPSYHHHIPISSLASKMTHCSIDCGLSTV
jgi:hypothetical protein